MLWAYRITPCITTGQSPFVLMRGRIPISKDNIGWMSGARKVNWSLVEVRKKLKEAHDAYKSYYDRRNNCKPVNISVNDHVRVKLPGIKETVKIGSLICYEYKNCSVIQRY